jgi:hypothetical protein
VDAQHSRWDLDRNADDLRAKIEALPTKVVDVLRGTLATSDDDRFEDGDQLCAALSTALSAAEEAVAAPHSAQRMLAESAPHPPYRQPLCFRPRLATQRKRNRREPACIRNSAA